MDILTVIFWIAILLLINVILITSGFIAMMYLPEFYHVALWSGLTVLTIANGAACGYACARALNK